MARQVQINSVRLLLELKTQLRTNDFRKITDSIVDGKSAECDEVVLERYLNHLDMLAGFWEEGLLTKRHVSESYRGLLIRIKGDSYIQSFMDEKGVNLYKPLKRLCNEV